MKKVIFLIRPPFLAVVLKEKQRVILKKAILFLVLMSSLISFSCGGGGSGSGSSAGGSGSTWPSGDYHYLNQRNANYNNGVIIRWETPILVNTHGIAGAENSFRQWGVPVTFVNYDPPEGVTLRIGSLGSGTCGVTYTHWYRSNGRMTSAEITIRSDLRGCVNTVTHEAGHALGIHGHTADGGLMDPAGGNGQITSPIRNMMNLLYSLPVGTNISQRLSVINPAQMKAFDQTRIPDGGGIVTWVDQ